MSSEISTTNASALPGSQWLVVRNDYEDPTNNGFSVLEILWNEFDGLMPGRWAKNFTSPQAKINWLKAWARHFETVGLKPAESRLGLFNLAKRSDILKWGTLDVGTFIELCRPVTSDEDAWDEACEQWKVRFKGPRVEVMTEKGPKLASQDTWSEPAIFWTARQFQTQLGQVEYEVIKERWSKALAKNRENPKGPVPQNLADLALPGKCSIEPAEQKRKIQELIASIRPPKPVAQEGRQRNLLSDAEIEERKRLQLAALAELEASKARRQHEGHHAYRQPETVSR